MAVIAGLRGTGLSVVIHPDRSFSLSDGRRLSLGVVGDARGKGLLEWADEETRVAVESYLDRMATTVPTASDPIPAPTPILAPAVTVLPAPAIPASLPEPPPGSTDILPSLPMPGSPAPGAETAEGSVPRKERRHRRSMASLFRTTRWALPAAVVASALLLAAIGAGIWAVLPGGPAHPQTPQPAGFLGTGDMPEEVRIAATQFSLGGLALAGQNPRLVPWDEMLGYRYPSTAGTIDAGSLVLPLALAQGDRVYAVAFEYPAAAGITKGLALVVSSPLTGTRRYEATPVEWSSVPIQATPAAQP